MIFCPTHYVTDDGGWEIRKLANTTHGDSSFPMPNVHFETASEEEEEDFIQIRSAIQGDQH